MKLTNALIVFRGDMYPKKKEIPFESVNMNDFPFFTTGVMLHEDFVIFIDNGGESKILKNRYGKPHN